MKTTKISAIVASVVLVIFMSVGSIANTFDAYSGDVTLTTASKKNILVKNSASVSVVLTKTVNEFRNMLTHVNWFVDGNDATEIKHTSFKYLQFNVNYFLNESSVEKSEMPVENEFEYLRFDANRYAETTESLPSEMVAENYDYLRFDVNNYAENSDAELTEIPLESFDYLRFDVNNYTSSNNKHLNEMPADDFSYLRFDVSKYTDNSANSTEALPCTE